MDALELNTAWNTNPSFVARALCASLSGFGYAGLTPEYIMERLVFLTSGGKPVGVIDMFLDGWLTKGTD